VEKEKTMKKKCLYLAVLLLFWAGQPVYSATEKSLPDLKKEVIRIIDRQTTLLTEVSDAIWEFAETALLEFKSSKLLADILEKKGFSVKREVAELPTAFVASYGSGKPIIGILAEYDALPGLSQDSTSFQKALVEGGSGHGCGHNLFGAGSLGAALAIKEVMESHKIKGTIRFYGCPAEEDVGGKVFMAREGLFDDLDACIAWHPDYTTKVDVKGSQAIDDIEIEFFGKTAHAAFDPWKGHSADHFRDKSSQGACQAVCQDPLCHHRRRRYSQCGSGACKTVGLGQGFDQKRSQRRYFKGRRNRYGGRPCNKNDS